MPIKVNTREIIDQINSEFGTSATKYASAADFSSVNPQLYNDCIDIIRDPKKMSALLMVNALGIPPVKAVAEYLEWLGSYKGEPFSTKVNSNGGSEAQKLGALFGFVFKNVLGFKDQKSGCAVNKLGIKTATRFLDGPICDFFYE